LNILDNSHRSHDESTTHHFHWKNVLPVDNLLGNIHDLQATTTASRTNAASSVPTTTRLIALTTKSLPTPVTMTATKDQTTATTITVPKTTGLETTVTVPVSSNWANWFVY